MKLFYTRTGKIFLGIISTISAFAFAVLIFLCAVFGSFGLFSSNTSDFDKELKEYAAQDYAAWVFYEADRGYTSDRLESMNCYYGIIAGDDISEMNLDLDSNYLYRNFSGIRVPKDAFIDVFGIGEQTEIRLSERFLDPWNGNDISSYGIDRNPDLTYYTFICFPNEEKMAVNKNPVDFYAQAKAFSDAAPTMKYFLPLATLVSFALAFGCWILFLCAAGHKKGVEGITEGFIERIPADLAFVLMLVLEGIIFGLMAELFYAISSIAFGLLGMFVVLGGCAAMLIGFLWSSNIAVNIKLHHVWKNSLIGRCINLPIKWLKKLHAESKLVRATIKWTNRIWIVYILVSILELIFIAASDSGSFFPFWLVEKIIVTFLLHRFLAYYARIKGAALSLAEGDTTAQVDLQGMPLFMEEHAKAMNEIQSGITVALEERTKSERMKTELITNVSHDIKTPLTSIINYVDLLEKEQPESEKVKEYLEVLDRQSKRLKKLIEDLIEASKAATGNVDYHMERVNAGVLLNQSVGEFTDRLEQNRISVVTNIPENDLYLTADSRYLWRVFDNLMNNIVKYAQSGTRAYISLEEADEKLRFVFRNTSREELNISADELMERFVRGDKSRYTDGNGLGLSIAKSLTESMGGSLTLSIDGDLFKAIVEFSK
ncbi:MAG: HAMP domain-containing histidine kinase [Lachnospiraceae bacterium]|nr:HAMP domain-containing histidine kinase [Lachnospiraceae bacterium]